MKDKVLNLLKKNHNLFISGETISDNLGVSRAAIWKYIKKLKEDGYVIESMSKNGYKLISSPDILTQNEIDELLSTKYIGRNIIHFDSIDSTNIKAKELASTGESNGTTVISEEQTSGRGRFGRNWHSPKYKGIWMSIILTPDIDPLNASNITLIAAAAVFKALKSLGIQTQIKWPNDIILNNKKLCGILTEMNSELNKINYIIIGIGVNVNTSVKDFLSEINSKATSLKVETGQNFSRQKLTSEILNFFEILYEEYIDKNCLDSTIQICKENSILIGKEIQLHIKGELIDAKVIDISEDGLLIVKYKNGRTQKIISGEVSMHGLY